MCLSCVILVDFFLFAACDVFTYLSFMHVLTQWDGVLLAKCRIFPGFRIWILIGSKPCSFGANSLYLSSLPPITLFFLRYLIPYLAHLTDCSS